MTLQTYEDHLRSREDQNSYRSTKLWTPNPHRVGMTGEQALADFFGYPLELVDKPGGDDGIDRQIQFLTPDGPRWIDCDVKTSTYGDFLRVDCRKAKKGKIFLLAHQTDQRTVMVGWQWGDVLLQAPKRNWCNNGTFVYYQRAKELREMHELMDRFTGLSRDPVVMQEHLSPKGI